MRPTIALGVALAAVLAVSCASAPPAPPPAPAGQTFEQKMASILQLEDQRVLRDSSVVVTVPPIISRGQPPPAVAPPPPPPDLIRLLSDSEARVRRRAALAVGRVGLREGIQPLGALLGDADPEVRQMAAFALGLLGDNSARASLVAALADPSPLMQGSAAEALGLIGDPAAAAPIGRLAAEIVQSGALREPPEDDADVARDSPAAAFRLAISALVRLKAYEPLAAAVTDVAGQPRVQWWPVAYALGRLEDKRALPALLALARDAHPYTRAFAIKGLGALKDPAAVPTLIPLVSSADRSVAIQTVRALGRIGDPAGAAPMLKMAQAADTDPQLRLEIVAAIGALRAPGVSDLLLDALSDPSPAIRAAALQSTATFDSEQFVAVLSGIDLDADWRVRAALASVLGTLTPDIGLPRLMTMLNDSDQRVIPSVLQSLVKLRAPNLAEVLLLRLKADDPVVRGAAATGLGEIKPSGADQALAEAYRSGQRDASYTARAAALAALANYGASVATPVLKAALADKDWAVRVRAAMLLKQLDPASSAEVDAEIRPAPTTVPPDLYRAPRLVNPSVSTEVYIDTDRGTIQLELAVLDAPLTVENFVTLAGKGFFNGLVIHRVVPDFVVQDGDPRGDGEGGPGYSIRDELSQRPYLRGTVGMALDPWPDTGGSQFFITHSPQPHLEAKYTVFGRVLAGMEVVDKIQQGDVIRRVRVWDGQTMTEATKGGAAR
jgi:cyclophilin family peptidyl-prolyl cis-trans isomerase/HEAT repeat protein